jgi:hypothetical protein
MEDTFETTNIHLDWLKNIYQELRLIQDMERIAREGCRDLMSYFEVPIEMQRIIMPDAQYKNIRFMVLELDILISNLAPVLKDKETEYKKRLEPVLKTINNRTLFLKEKKQNNQLVGIDVLPMMNTTIDYLSSIKSSLIKDIGHVLYLPEEAKKEW